MSTFAIVLLCVQACLVQSIYGGCCRKCCFKPSNGGTFEVISTSCAPTGISVQSENSYCGDVDVCGCLPFLGTVCLEGCMPTCGCAGVEYSCGCGECEIESENGCGCGCSDCRCR